MKEELQKYALIAEIISALAVVAGLIFVGIQIKQSTEQNALNTRALEVSGYQDLIGQIIAINNTVLANPELSDLIMRGKAGELTDPVDRGRYGTYLINVTRHADMACYQYQQGILNEERLAAVMAIFFVNVVQYQNEPIPEAYTPGLSKCLEISGLNSATQR